MNKKQFDGIVHYVDDNIIYGSKNNIIFVSNDNGDTWEVLTKIPLNNKDKFKSITRLSRRLFRMGVYHIEKLGNYLVIFAFKKIYQYDLNQNIIKFCSDIIGGRPLSICKVDDILYYGEYISNPNRRAVKVFGSDDFGVSWKEYLSIDGVRHIHGVYYDKYEDNIWITTGDYKDENGIYRCDTNFNNLTKYLGGDQQTRAVSLQFTKDYIYYGTDTPLEDNYIYQIKRDNKDISKIQKVENSIFYSAKTDSQLFFATVCEPSVNNDTKLVHLWCFNEIQNKVYKVVTVKKDMFSMKYFQYGQILFPKTYKTNSDLWITYYATQNDQQSVILELNNVK